MSIYVQTRTRRLSGHLSVQLSLIALVIGAQVDAQCFQVDSFTRGCLSVKGLPEYSVAPLSGTRPWDKTYCKRRKGKGKGLELASQAVEVNSNLTNETSMSTTATKVFAYTKEAKHDHTTTIPFPMAVLISKVIRFSPSVATAC